MRPKPLMATFSFFWAVVTMREPRELCRKKYPLGLEFHF